MRRDQIGAQHRADHLGLVLVALGPQRPDRPIDHACRQNRALRRPPFALEETTGDLSRCVHPLFDVDREGEEVRALARFLSPHRRCEHHRLARARNHRAVGLLRELARFERDFLPADGHADHGLAFCGNRHQLSSTFLRGRVGTRVSVVAGARSNLQTPFDRYPVPDFSLAWARTPFRATCAALVP